LFVTIGVLNYALDVKSLFHRERIDEAAEWLKDGHDLLEIHLINNRYLQKKYIETLSERNSIVVLGQSRCNKIGQELFPHQRFFNHWAPRGSVYEMLAFYNIYERKGILPKEIIIGLSPQTLSTEWEHKDKVLAEDFNEMCAKLGFEQFAVPFPRVRNEVFLLRELFSANYLMTNLKYDPLIPRIAEDRNHPAIYLNDGSSAQKSFIAGPKNMEQAREIIDIEVLPIKDFQEDQYAFFEAFLKHLAEYQNIKVSFFVLPYHPLIYDHEHLKEPLENWHTRISKWSANYNIEVIGDLNPHDFELVDADYLDIDHVSREATQRIFEIHRNQQAETLTPLK